MLACRRDLWQALANPYTAEICAGAGYDWLLFDGEHAPNTIQTLLAQLQAVARHPVEPVVRPAVGDPVVIKQYLDIGFRSLLVPMVESAASPARPAGRRASVPMAAILPARMRTSA